ncbi:hypothetical protein N657DRAFT_393091 [Parathielavia appendiculata]|uniref:Uncharacterized protein n=1 Tax=Parathielavia appendiculata TaxID=2587402 RepID=A0AAN6U2A4_9PEZI|nr:hypothetical protein N657DRAFT_393091 [Parathielavia appendiculata]
MPNAVQFPIHIPLSFPFPLISFPFISFAVYFIKPSMKMSVPRIFFPLTHPPLQSVRLSPVLEVLLLRALVGRLAGVVCMYMLHDEKCLPVPVGVGVICSSLFITHYRLPCLGGQVRILKWLRLRPQLAGRAWC